MIRPVLEYGCIIFDNCIARDSLKLESCQRSAALICTGAMRRTETSKLMSDLGWVSLATRRNYLKMTFFYKVLFNLTSPYLSKNIPQAQNHNYNLREKKPNYLTEIRGRLLQYKNSFFPSRVCTWNNLPCEITNATHLSSFSNKLRTHLNMSPNEDLYVGIFEHSHPGFFGKLLVQIRLGLSPLRDQLFRYNLTDNPFCPSCGDAAEAPAHFFFDCVSYAPFRANMLDNIKKLDNTLISQIDILKFILFGSQSNVKNERIRINNCIFRHVMIYMFKSCHF